MRKNKLTGIVPMIYCFFDKRNQIDKKFSVTYYNEWNEKSIDERQLALAKIAKDIWGF